MLSRIHSVMVAMLAASASAGAASPDWVTTTLDAPCDVTDIDFSDASHGFATCAFGDAMTTDDGGLNWHVFGTGLQQSLVWAHAESADVLYAARLGFYRSIDGGQTWSELGGLSQITNTIFDAHVIDSQHIALVKAGSVHYSENGGQDWTEVYETETFGAFHQLDFPTAQTGFATGGYTSEQGSIGIVARTIDGGRTWTPLAFTHDDIRAADFFDATHGVVATYQGIYTTADGGDTWQSNGPLPGSNDVLMDIAHRDATHWFAASYNGALYETRDAGATWAPAYQDPQERALASLSVAGGAVIAGGNDGYVLYENRIFNDGFD